MNEAGEVSGLSKLILQSGERNESTNQITSEHVSAGLIVSSPHLSGLRWGQIYEEPKVTASAKALWQGSIC